MHHVERHKRRVARNVHCLDAHCRSAHGTYVLLVEVDAHALAGRHQKFVVAGGDDRSDKLVVIVELDCYLAVALDGIVFFERSLFDKALLYLRAFARTLVSFRLVRVARG